MICNAELCPNYFSLNVSVLTVVFRRQISKKTRVLPKYVVFLEIVGELKLLVRKRSQKITYVILHYISLYIYPLHFPKFCPIQKQKNAKTLLVFGENDSRRLSQFLQTHIF